MALFVCHFPTEPHAKKVEKIKSIQYCGPNKRENKTNERVRIHQPRVHSEGQVKEVLSVYVVVCCVILPFWR